MSKHAQIYLVPLFNGDESVFFFCSCSSWTEALILQAILGLLCSMGLHKCHNSHMLLRPVEKNVSSVTEEQKATNRTKVWRLSRSSYMQPCVQAISCVSQKKTLKEVLLVSGERKMLTGSLKCQKSPINETPSSAVWPVLRTSTSTRLQSFGLGESFERCFNLHWFHNQKRVSRSGCWMEFLLRKRIPFHAVIHKYWLEKHKNMLSLPMTKREEQACCPWYNFEFFLELRRDGLDDIQRYISI